MQAAEDRPRGNSVPIWQSMAEVSRRTGYGLRLSLSELVFRPPAQSGLIRIYAPFRPITAADRVLGQFAELCSRTF